MHSNFEQSLAHLLGSEGGWSDRPIKDDPGGATMQGITLSTFRRYIKPGATKADLKAITRSQVRTIYKRHYWDEVMGDDLPAGIDYAVFDFAVNSGPGRAAKKLQKVLNVPQDGKIGPKTLAAARNVIEPKALLISYMLERLDYLKHLRNWEANKNGWKNRLTAVTHDATAMLIAASEAPAPASRWSFFKALVKGKF